MLQEQASATRKSRATNQGSNLHTDADGHLFDRSNNLNGVACTTSELDDQEFSIISKPGPGAKIGITLSTGDFLSGGIGPNAYAIGEWRNELVNPWRPPHTQPSRVKQVPESLRDKLPLHQINHSSVKYYCPIIISLSPKDVRRWQLAGAALQKEFPLAMSTSSPQHEKPLLNFDSPGGSSRGAYFAIEQRLIGLTAPYQDDVFDTYWRSPRNYQQHVVLLRRFYNNCLEVEELKLGSTSAVTMLPGLLYGGLHLALWNYVFPSRTERLLWRMSGIVLIAIPVLVAVALMLRMACLRYMPSQRSQQPNPHQRTTTAAAADHRASRIVLQEGKTKSKATLSAANIGRDNGGVEKGDTAVTNIPISQILLFDLALFLGTLTSALYVFSRVFIIIEFFISLRHVPVGVYIDVGWSKYIPHL
ncbi:MAG: hypothetical protein L6R38_005492 [Xanthoria sp. 2 TBL-2021]|nr:MAG: hypothetical protein L6R38_005492 [Xanthoria sp. 2 TBL-2021]